MENRGDSTAAAAAALDSAWRTDWGRLLGLLAARFRDLDLAEDALADAYEAAARTWPSDGVPANPAGWLMTAARRRALDRLRSAGTAYAKLPLLVVDAEPSRVAASETDEPGLDDELRLLFLTCHPALALPSQAALALRLVLGVPTAEIARLFLVPEATVAARITRGKRKMARAALPLRLPEPDALGPRIAGVVEAIYLCFTAGYAPGTGNEVVRLELAGEAIRLARLLRGWLEARPAGASLQHEGSTVDAVLALMLLQHSRRGARVDDSGAIVLLADQDRSRWHHDEIAEGLELLRGIPVGEGRAEELRLQAVIAAGHAVATTAADTDWPRIAAGYARLELITGSPVVRLNRAVAVAEAEGPTAGLALLEGLDDLLPQSHRLPAVRAELLARAGDRDAAVAAFEVAIERCDHGPELAHLRRRRDDLAAPGP